jgi:type VI protein secretion system component VasK
MARKRRTPFVIRLAGDMSMTKCHSGAAKKAMVIWSSDVKEPATSMVAETFPFAPTESGDVSEALSILRLARRNPSRSLRTRYWR